MPATPREAFAADPLPPLYRQPALWLALALYLAVCAWFVADGPMAGGDTPRYLDGASAFLDSGEITGKAASYRAYVLFVAIAELVTPDRQTRLWLIVALQAVALAVALVCLYDTARRLFSPTAAAVAALLFAGNFYAVRWAPWILTESVFTAAVVITVWLCVAARGRSGWLLAALAASLITALFRPNGIAMLPVFLLFLSVEGRGPMRWLPPATAIVAVLLAGDVGSGLERTASHENLLGQFERGTVIYDFEYRDMPSLDAPSGSDLADLPRYLASYPGDTLALVGHRLWAAWSWHRASYSAPHRLLLGLTIPILYALALLGLVRSLRRASAARLLPLALIAAQSAVIAISFANHDHRFVNYVMPMVFLYAGAGVAVLLEARRRDTG